MVLVVWLTLLTGVYAILLKAVRPSFVAAENHLALADIRRVQADFAQEVDQLRRSASDYAVWTAMRDFVRTRDEKFKKEELADTLFKNLDVHLLAIYDAERRVVFAKAFDGEQNRDIVFPERDWARLKELLPGFPRTSAGASFAGLSRAGTLRLSDGRLFDVAAYPIVDSNGNGPVVGAVVFGRRIDAPLVRSVAARLNLPFELETTGVNAELATDGRPEIVAGKVMVTLPWLDTSGRTIARLRLSREASFVVQGEQTLVFAGAGTLVVLTIVLGVLLWMLRVTVVLPLQQLTVAIEEIQATGILDARVALARSDEIGVIARSFNGMLALLNERATELERLASFDELTGLLNRRAITGYLQEQVEFARRYQHGLAVLLLDVDHFKKINDTRGHAAGDTVLQGLARVIKSSLRGTDRIGRFGGEEFLIVTPHQSSQGGTVVAERLRRAVEQMQVLEPSWPLTVSIGVAHWSGQSPDKLVAIADVNLYRAKHAGRNRVVDELVADVELV